MERSTHRLGPRLATLGAVAILVAACGGGGSVNGAVDLSKIEASVAYIQTQGTFVTAD